MTTGEKENTPANERPEPPALPTFSSTMVTVVPASRKFLTRTSSLRLCFIS